MTKINPVIQLLVALAFFAISQSTSATSLSDCADQFIDGDVSNAPTMYSSTPEEQYRQNRHHCYKSDGHSLFALEYYPKHHAPRWIAYKLSDRYGENGCTSRPRAEMRCYFKDQTWQKVEECVDAYREERKSKADDPFHEDPFLVNDGVEHLKKNPFRKTGHDRGHMAPNNAFSWNLCATYHTFTMANMSPQRANLNRQQWNRLEQQVLYWGAEHGPIYVVTGTIFNKFPARRFRIYKTDAMDEDAIYPKRTSLRSFSTGDPVNNPDVVVPTGYFKVVFRPSTDSEPAHAIGFLLPHTNEKIKSFWDFISRIDVIEKASGVRFTGIPTGMKDDWNSDFFYERKVGGWHLRNSCDNNYTAEAWIEDSTYEQRMEKCNLQ